MGPKKTLGGAWWRTGEEFQPAGNSLGLKFLHDRHHRHRKLHSQGLSAAGNGGIRVQRETEQAAAAVSRESAIRMNVNGLSRAQHHHQQQADNSHPALKSRASELTVLRHFVLKRPGQVAGCDKKTGLIILISKELRIIPRQLGLVFIVTEPFCLGNSYLRNPVAVSFPPAFSRSPSICLQGQATLCGIK